MVGKWKVTMQYICENKMYAVYRLRNAEATDHSGNREFACEYIYTDKRNAQALAEQLNCEVRI